MLLISRGSHAYKIIMLLLITGEFPFRSLGLLGNERMMKETAVRMTQVHVIHIMDIVKNNKKQSKVVYLNTLKQFGKKDGLEIYRRLRQWSNEYNITSR